MGSFFMVLAGLRSIHVVRANMSTAWDSACGLGREERREEGQDMVGGLADEDLEVEVEVEWTDVADGEVAVVREVAEDPREDVVLEVESCETDRAGGFLDTVFTTTRLENSAEGVGSNGVSLLDDADGLSTDLRTGGFTRELYIDFWILEASDFAFWKSVLGWVGPADPKIQSDHSNRGRIYTHILSVAASEVDDPWF
jgi:hypothetical protein